MGYTQNMNKNKNMTIKKLKEFKFENYYTWVGFPKENSYHSMKSQQKKGLLLLATILLQKLTDASNA